MNIDFHLHTRYSDGGKTPEEIIKIAEGSNIGYISITDHNTFKTYEKKYNTNVKMITGMEIETKYKDLTLHMLLYNFDLNSKLLREYYLKNRKYEIYHFNKLVKECEIINNITIDKKIKRNFIRNNNYFDKVRLNDLLVMCGLADTAENAYYKYTKDVKEYKRYKISMEELFKLENDSKGIISIAHPLKYKLDLNDTKKLILELKDKFNLRVVEAINNRQTLEEEKELIKLCKDNNLYISAGSDSHYKFGSTSTSKVVGKINNRKVEEREVTFLELIGE